MAYLVGALLALAVSGMATLSRLDRDRAFYPTLMVVIASYYALFAVIGGSDHALSVETGVITVFLAASLGWVQVLSLARRSCLGGTRHL